ncbi:MAG: GNAT family N-acetyltransferase [Granulosicoccus sp.]
MTKRYIDKRLSNSPRPRQSVMHPGIFLYKAIKTVCDADICRVLVLDARVIKPLDNGHALKCLWLGSEDVVDLMRVSDFAVSQQFVDDFKQFGFLGVAAVIDDVFVGMLFLVPDFVVARHNSGGTGFDGIRVTLPKGVYYLFKVVVRPEFRGMRVNAAMMTFAIEQLGTETLTALVTTTDWTNRAFLKSAAEFGFRRCGITAELVVAGMHYYYLPKAMEPVRSEPVSNQAESRMIQFGRA